MSTVEYNAYLRSHCLDHADFVDLCSEFRSEYSEMASKQMSYKSGEAMQWNLALGQRTKAAIDDYFVRYKVSSAMRTHLSRVAFCILFNEFDNQTIQLILKWNEIDYFGNHKILVRSQPQDTLIARSSLEGDQFIIYLSSGFRNVLSVAAAAFSELTRGRKVLPTGFMPEMVRQVADGRPPSRLHVPQLEYAEAGMHFYLAKLFVFCHEIVHGKFRVGHSPPCKNIWVEEHCADVLGFTLYLCSAFMLVPPFDGLLADGTIGTVRERQTKMQSMQQDVDPKLVGLLWAIPILVFRLVECIEKSSGKSSTHPPVKERLKELWANLPNPVMQRRVEQELVPILDDLFLGC
jgi:hypothetical protein